MLQWPAVKMDREGSTLVITTEDQNGGRVLIDLLAAKQIVPESFEVMEPSLESLFAEAVQ
jgi:ABC-2 type transport system ATP-binding protein